MILLPASFVLADVVLARLDPERALSVLLAVLPLSFVPAAAFVSVHAPACRKIEFSSGSAILFLNFSERKSRSYMRLFSCHSPL